jgi:hypothetical protein
MLLQQLPTPAAAAAAAAAVHACCRRDLTFAGSVIGNLKMTQEMLDFCGQHGIHADVEVSNELLMLLCLCCAGRCACVAGGLVCCRAAECECVLTREVGKWGRGGVNQRLRRFVSGQHGMHADMEVSGCVSVFAVGDRQVSVFLVYPLTETHE